MFMEISILKGWEKQLLFLDGDYSIHSEGEPSEDCYQWRIQNLKWTSSIIMQGSHWEDWDINPATKLWYTFCPDCKVC